MDTTLYDPATYVKPHFRDAQLGDPMFQASNVTVELKQDGIWSITIVKQGIGTIYHGTTVKGTMDFPKTLTCVFAGEFMFGSNWAIRHNCTGELHVFDVLALDNTDLRDAPLWQRRVVLNTIFSRDIPNHQFAKNSMVYRSHCAQTLWDFYIEKEDFEGLVFKNECETWYQASWARVKKVFTVDYAIIEIKEGAGRLAGKAGALVGALHIGNKLVPVCTVGGGMSDALRQEIWEDPDKYLYTVMEVKGWKLFPSGALRHPNLVRFRSDKFPEDCVMPTL